MFDRNQYIRWAKASQENASPDMNDFRNGYWAARNVQQTGQNNVTGSLEDIIKNVTGSGNEVEVPQDSNDSMQLNELSPAAIVPLAKSAAVGIGAGMVGSKAAEWAKKRHDVAKNRRMKSSSQVHGGSPEGTNVSSPDYSNDK